MNFEGWKKSDKGIIVPNDMADRGRVGGVFHAQLVRGGKVIDEWRSKNLLPNAALDNILAVWLAGGSQTSNWYLAPYGNNYTPNANDTAANLTAYGEITAYTAGTRVAYAAVEGQQTVTNAASPASFAFNVSAATSIYGAFLCSGANKNSQSGILAAASLFQSPKQVSNGDQLNLTYSVSLAPA